MSKSYDSYVEPCQLCIDRAGQGKHDLIKECGWCNDSDTHHQTTSKYPGDIVKIPYGGDGYPFHNSPHHERKYYLGRKHVASMDGGPPVEEKGSASKSRGKSGSRGKWIVWAIVIAVILYFFSKL